MSAKQEILQRIRSAQASAKLPDHVDAPRNYHTTGITDETELREVLIDRLVDYKADVYETNEAGLPAKIAEILTQRESKIVRYAEGMDEALFAEVDGEVTPDDRSSDPRLLDVVDAVVTESHVSCAETGTIVLEAGPTNGRRALTLVPDRHIVIVRQPSIVFGVPEMIARLDPEKPATMISGPSATSDIELSRVEGVHGPRDLIVIIVS